MLEQDTGIEDNVPEDALETEELNEDAPTYDEYDKDKLIEELQKREDEIAKTKKSYDELRSMEDRRSTKLTERLAKLEGMLEAKQEQTPVETKADYSDIMKEMEDAIEEDPKNAAKYFVQFAQEFQAMMGEQKQALESDVTTRLARESAVYKNNKDFVDKLCQRGMDMASAIEFVSEVKEAENPIAQPGTPKAPGVVEAGRASGTKKELPKIEISPLHRRIFEAAGLTEKEIAEAAREAAKDMVNE